MFRKLNFRLVFWFSSWGLLLGLLPGLIHLYLQVFNWGWTWRFWCDNFIITIWFIRGYDRGYVAFIKHHFSNFSVVLIFVNHKILQIISNWYSILRILKLLSANHFQKSNTDFGDRCSCRMLVTCVCDEC